MANKNGQKTTTFINEHNKQARRFLSSFGTVSSDMTKMCTRNQTNFKRNINLSTNKQITTNTQRIYNNS